MSSPSLYVQSVPVLIKYLHNLSSIIQKGEDWAKENGKKPEEVLESRLIADMKEYLLPHPVPAFREN
jgi:hypothetical protein